LGAELILRGQDRTVSCLLSTEDPCNASATGCCAGNSTQKKWSCSIKAVPEGEDSRTIGSWLHATGLAKARRLGALKGHTIWILWPLENAFFKGTVTGLNAATGLHHVNYDDGALCSLATSTS